MPNFVHRGTNSGFGFARITVRLTESEQEAAPMTSSRPIHILAAFAALAFVSAIIFGAI